MGPVAQQQDSASSKKNTNDQRRSKIAIEI